MDLRQGPISHLHGPCSSGDCSKRTACGSAQIPATSPRARAIRLGKRGRRPDLAVSPRCLHRLFTTRRLRCRCWLSLWSTMTLWLFPVDLALGHIRHLVSLLQGAGLCGSASSLDSAHPSNSENNTPPMEGVAQPPLFSCALPALPLTWMCLCFLVSPGKYLLPSAPPGQPLPSCKLEAVCLALGEVGLPA